MQKVVSFALGLVSACIILAANQTAYAETLLLNWSNAGAGSFYQLAIGTSSNNYPKKYYTTGAGVSIEHVPSETPLFIRISKVTPQGQILSSSHQHVLIVPRVNGVTPQDSDGDGIPDGLDNCPFIYNASQADSNNNGVGDACDDGSFPGFENPVYNPNPTPYPTPFPTPTNPDNGSNPDNSSPHHPGNPNNNGGTGGGADQGTQTEILRSYFCSEWNGFFTMYNFAELRNQSTKRIVVDADMFTMNASFLSRTTFTIAPGTQVDIPLHELEGFTKDNYGRVCFSYEGVDGLLGGQVSYYLPEQSSGKFQFAYSSPFTNGKKGTVFVPTNTYNPSLHAAKENNPVANWIQVTNNNMYEASGTLYFHAQNGALIGNPAGHRIHLEAGERRDISGHSHGKRVGMARWVPDSEEDEFLVRVVRYVYDNPLFLDSFDTAFQINGVQGTGALLSVPLDTTQGSSVIELMNTLNEAVGASVEIRDESGAVVAHLQIGKEHLPAYGSFHIITDQILGAGKRGSAYIKGSKNNSIAAVSMIYARDQYANLNFMYGITATPVKKKNLVGSYNTFLGKKPFLAVTNPGNQFTSITIALRTFSNTPRTIGNVQHIPPKGTLYLDLSAYEEENTYGQVSVSSNSAVSAWIIREKLENFGIPNQLE